MNSSAVLDDKQRYSKYDEHQTLASIAETGSQIQHIWELSQQLNFESDYKNYNLIVVAGMGGSVLGTDVIKSVFKEQLDIPIIVTSDYTVPSYVNEKTLVIASSYSGNTEETLAALQDAHAKKAKLTGICTGGKIAAFFESLNAPALVYEPKHNPSQTARMGLGYSIFGQMALLAQLDAIQLNQQQVDQLLTDIAQVHLEMSDSVAQEENKAKMLAFRCFKKMPVICGAEFLEGSSHVFANQLNENAKTFAEYRVVPEMHHHLLEGLQEPDALQTDVEWVILNSKEYHQRNQLRMRLTTELLDTQRISFTEYTLQIKTKLSQAFETILLGAYTAFYMALLYGVDPIPNPNVDWLKNQLKERS